MCARGSRLPCLCALLMVALVLAACSEKSEEPMPTPPPQGPAPQTEFQLTSPAFEDGTPVPAQYTADGKDVSPPLKWSNVPEGTRCLALICDDPDAPRGTWVHWVLYGLPTDAVELPEGVPATDTLVNGASQGKNDSKRIGYRGPAPPRGKPHRYFFKLYALDSRLELKPGATKQELLDAMDGHVLAEARLIGTYQRK